MNEFGTTVNRSGFSFEPPAEGAHATSAPMGALRHG